MLGNINAANAQSHPNLRMTEEERESLRRRDDPTNSQRGSWAFAGLEAYARQTRHYEVDWADEADEIISDFLTDLRHFADSISLSQELLAQHFYSSAASYRDEVAEEDDSQQDPTH